MKILVFGGHGQAGFEFLRLASGHAASLVAPSRAELDVRRFEQLQTYISASAADLIVNLTGFHVLEQCDEHFVDALTINAAAVREMALAAARTGARFVTVSTDYVFDGRSRTPYCEDDAAFPIQAYGVSKRAGELAALAANPGTTIIARTCGLYGGKQSTSRGPNFVERRLSDFSRLEQLEVGNDLCCTPTSAQSFAEALFRLSTSPNLPGGIYHLTAEGACTWADFAAEIARLSKARCKVIGIDRRGDYGTVRRPAYSVLANRRAASLGIRLPHWREDLAHYMAGRKRD